MSRLDDLIAELCPDGVECKPLGELCESISSGKSKSKHNTGDFIVYGSTGIIGYSDYYDYNEDTLLIARVGANCGYVHKATGKYSVSDNTLVVKTTKEYDMTFAYYQLTNINLNLFSAGGGQPLVTSGKLKKITIPVPPLPVQQEIVRILDNFTELTAELTAEHEARKKQYEYYRDELLTNADWEDVHLGDLCTLITKGTTPKKYIAEGIRFIKTESFVDNVVNNDRTVFISEEIHFGVLKRSILQEKDILFTIAGATIGKCASVEKENLPANTNQALAIIRLNTLKVKQRFVFYVLQSNRMSKYIAKKVKGSAQPNLNLQQMNEFPVPLPSLDEQDRIVTILDHFDALANDMSQGLPAEIVARQKQYEYYRDKLLTFKEKVS